MEGVKKTAECGGKELSYLNYSALAKQRREFIINGAMTDTLKKKTKQQKLRNKKKKSDEVTALMRKEALGSFTIFIPRHIRRRRRRMFVTIDM